MKLRIRGNSIRLRLGRSEVRRLVDEGRVEEETVFGPRQSLTWALESAAGAAAVAARFEGSRLVVRVPRDVARRWSAGDEVGISAEQPVDDGTGRRLSILIEKDFECVDASESEPQDDAFPNPRRC